MDFLNSSTFTLDGESSEHDTSARSGAVDVVSDSLEGSGRAPSESSEEVDGNASEESWYEEDSFVVNDDVVEYESDAPDASDGSDDESCSDDSEDASSESDSEEESDSDGVQVLDDEDEVFDDDNSDKENSPFFSSEATESSSGKSRSKRDRGTKTKKHASTDGVSDKDRLLQELYPELSTFSSKPPKKKALVEYSDDVDFVHSLDSTDEEVNKYAAKRVFQREKDELCRRLYGIFRERVFYSQLPEEIPIKWNPRLLKTAGFWKRRGEIELSTKVCDSPARVRDTLLHEMCHAAVTKIDGVDEKHGKNFRKWQKFPSIPPVERCHSYKINTKYTFICRQCRRKVNRHTKSLKVCPTCSGDVEVIANGSSEGSTPKSPNKFALFVQENYHKYRTKGSSHAQVMRTLSTEYKTTTASVSSADPTDGGATAAEEAVQLSFAELVLEDQDESTD